MVDQSTVNNSHHLTQYSHCVPTVAIHWCTVIPLNAAVLVCAVFCGVCVLYSTCLHGS